MNLEPGSWEAIYDAQAPTCPHCGLRLKGQHCTCETPVVRDRQVPVWEPAAVVAVKCLKAPETIWFDSRYPHTRGAAIRHARRLAQAGQGVCEVL